MIDKQKLLAGGHSREDFERWVDMRCGTGEPVYWYGWGDMSTYPEGKMIARLEGFDTGRLYRPDPDKPEVELLARKHVAFRDPETGELLRGDDGAPYWMDQFVFQHFTWKLDGDRIIYKADVAYSDPAKAQWGAYDGEIQKFERMRIYTCPVQITFPFPGPDGKPVYGHECYDFVERQDGDKIRYHGTWSGFYPMPPWAGSGNCTMHAYFQRFNSYEELPETTRAFVEEYAPMWKQPPKDHAEIDSLRLPIAVGQ